MTDFRPFTKIVNSFLEHNLEVGQIFRDSGLAQYGQERLYKSKQLLVVTRTTRTFAFVTSDWGSEFMMRVLVNEQGPFIVKRDGVRDGKPLNCVFRVWENPTRKEIENIIIGVDESPWDVKRAKTVCKLANIE